MSSFNSFYICLFLLSKNFFSIKAAYSFISKTFIELRKDCFYLSYPTFESPFSSIYCLNRSPSFCRFSFWAFRVEISASLLVMMFLSSENSVRSLTFSFFSWSRDSRNLRASATLLYFSFWRAVIFI